MALSFGDSIKKNAASVKSVSAIDTSLFTVDDTLPYSDKYERYTEYSDPNYSVIDKNKNITLDPTQVNLTQEENSQYVPFKMFRFYDGVDILKMTLLMHAVTPLGGDVHVTPVNVQYDDESIYFGLILPGSVCATKGTVQMEIQAIGVNEKGNPYKLITRSANFNVLESLSGNGVVEPTPDTGWITTFLNQVTEKVGQAQSAANDAQAAASRAEQAATEATQTVSTAKQELTNSVNTTITKALEQYYTKAQINEMMKNIDLTEVYAKIDAIDGLAKFNVTCEGATITFYNGDKVIKSVTVDTTPSTEWVTAYGNIVDSKITGALNPVTQDLASYKETVNTDLAGIHSAIDDLPETLKSDYYTKTETDEKLKTKAAASDLTKVQSSINAQAEQIKTNKNNISALGTKVTNVEQALEKVDQSPQKTYDATYSENRYTLYEIEHEGQSDEVRTVKSQFTIVGGSGGGGTSSALKIEYITTSPLTITVNDKAEIKYRFTGKDSSGDVVPEGQFTWKIGNTIIAKGTAIAGENTFDATEYLVLGTQKLTLSITDDAGSLVTKSWTVQKIDIRLESSFNDKITYNIDSVSFDYTPYGAITKEIHIKLDGKELTKITTSASGVPSAYVIPSQSHGSHLVDAYITATLNGSVIESNHIYKDIIWFDPSSDKPVIGCVNQSLDAKQYDTTNITYTVYDPKTDTPVVTLLVDDVEVSTLTLDSNTQIWQYKPTTVGTHTLKIKCRDTVKIIEANVTKLDIDVQPITAGLQFDFNPVGRSNNDANRLWSDGDVAMTVSDNFDWVNGGYQLDENGDQYFGIRAGTTATISYNLFADDARKNGKEFKLIFKTSSVARSNATFLSCKSGDIGLQMNVHEAYISSSAKNLYVPYSEEDIIEFEFNINKDSDIPVVMAYEDGTPGRPMIYTTDHSFTQTSPVPIVIGSTECDVRIYRMKAYNTSLNSSAILSNFIADARTATEMIDRYKRNQIYDENNLLTPDTLAEKCPYMRVLKLEAPHFTSSKKDFIKNTSFEYIYKNGDPILDNWKFINAYHAGQGTTSDAYGAAGRNIDIIACFDGKHQATSKIPLDPTYVTELIMGDGTRYSDGTGKITLTRTSVPNNWLNIKVNIASSEMVNNGYLQKRYNTYLPYQTPATRRDSRIKNNMEFVNAVLFVKESDPDLSTHKEFQDTDWHFYALCNIGDSKKTDHTRAYDPDDEKEFCIEVSDNTLPNSIFQTGVYNSDNSMKYPISRDEWKAGNPAYEALYNDWDGTFEFRYDCCGDSKDGSAITTDEEKTRIRTENKQIFRNFYEFVITSTDKEFKEGLSNWFIPESIYYFYLFTSRYLMIDNRAKNVFYHWAKIYISNAEAKTMGEKAKYYTVDDAAAAINNGYRFDYWDYDNDSALGINNSGELTLSYGKEDTDYRTEGDPSSGYVFNAAENVLFCRVRDLMKDELRKMYNTCESNNCWSASSLINQFDELQEEWPEELWRLDYVRKYERPYRNGNTRFLTEMMNGRKKYQRRQFEREQEIYMATKWASASVSDNQIMFRCNTPKSATVTPDYTLHLTPFQDMYLDVAFGNSEVKQLRAKAGQEYSIACPYTTMDDTAVLIYAASRIQSVGDVSKCYIHDNDFSKAIKMKELIIGNSSEGYSNVFLTTLTLGKNELLQKLDIQNTPNLAQTLDISQCGNLQEIYANGSGLTGVLFANGGKIKLAYLPANMTSVNMKNLHYLTDLTVEGYDKISTMIVESCSSVDVKSLVESCTNLNRARITGIDWRLEDGTLLEKLYNMSGIDKNGYNTDRSVVAGKVYVPTMREKLLSLYREAWPDLTITYDTLIAQFTVTFVNDNGVVLDVQYVDKGEKPVDPVKRKENPIATPTKDSTVSTDFTYTGWDSNLVAVFSNQTYTAVYSESLRQYTVKYMSKGRIMQSVTGDYGTYVEYTGDIPVYTAEETAYKYYLFTHWDKSGYVDGDKEINAEYDVCEYVQDYFKGKDLSTLRPVEIYALTQLGLSEQVASLKDHVEIDMSHDYNFSDIEQKELISEKTVFNGENYIDTEEAVLSEDRDFVLAIDYKFDRNSSNSSVLMQCYKANGFNGFKLWNSSGAKTSWGTSATITNTMGSREMLVLRHVKGETGLHVYASNLTGNTSSYVELTRTRSTVTDATLVFGCAKADDGAFENYAVGEIYWCKLWYTDLGDSACKNLVSWTHSSIGVDMCGFKQFYLSDNPSKRSSMTFLASTLLQQKKSLSSSSGNSGGYANTQLPAYLNGRLYDAFPVEWKQIIKKVKVMSSIGDQSTEISSSDNYIYIPSVYELDPSYGTDPYIYEGSTIQYMTTEADRICKYEDGSTGSYWTRSPNYQYQGYWFRVEETGTISGYYYAYSEEGIRIMFSI